MYFHLASPAGSDKIAEAEGPGRGGVSCSVISRRLSEGGSNTRFLRRRQQECLFRVMHGCRRRRGWRRVTHRGVLRITYRPIFVCLELLTIVQQHNLVNRRYALQVLLVEYAPGYKLRSRDYGPATTLPPGDIFPGYGL